MKRKIFARGQPILRARDERLPRLADHFELIVTEPFLERRLYPIQLRRNRLRLRDVIRDDEPAPDHLGRRRRQRASRDEREAQAKQQTGALLHGKITSLRIPMEEMLNRPPRELSRDPPSIGTSRSSRSGSPP